MPWSGTMDSRDSISDRRGRSDCPSAQAYENVLCAVCRGVDQARAAWHAAQPSFCSATADRQPGRKSLLLDRTRRPMLGTHCANSTGGALCPWGDSVSAGQPDRVAGRVAIVLVLAIRPSQRLTNAPEFMISLGRPRTISDIEGLKHSDGI